MRPPAPAAHSQGRRQAAGSRRILIVEDNSDAAESLSIFLGIAGHTTALARDGLEAVSAAEQFRPDVILLDLGLPKMDGFDVCRRIREQTWAKNVIVVALTALSHDDDRLKSRKAGFDMHLVKPVDPETLSIVLAAATQVPRTD